MRPSPSSPRPFCADRAPARRGSRTPEPFHAEKAGVKARFFLFAKDGYPPYGTTIVTTQKVLAEKPDAVARFVRASMEGWKSYLASPGAANELIKKDNPSMQDDQIAYGIAKLKEYELVTGGDAAKMGIGTMTDERWKKTFEYMVAQGLLKADVDLRKPYTPPFVQDLKVMP